jgi:DNA-binding LacI/PurR family transcriptional regulator
MGVDIRKPAPLYLQIIQDLRERILREHLPPGARIGSQAELASRYGVSLITVKKAVADLIKEGVLYSRMGKGTYVAARPAEFRLSRTKAIGVVLTDLSSPFFSLIVKGVEEAAAENGYTILLSNSANHAGKEEQQIRHFIDLGVAGLVIASMTHDYSVPDTLRDLREKEFPFVMVSYSPDPAISRVGTDHYLGARMATDHLVQLGYSRIGYVNGEQGNLVGEERRRGYEDALASHGLQSPPEFRYRLRLRGEQNDYRSGREIGEQCARSKQRPDALFVYNDLAALGIEHALVQQGVRIPEDIAVVGFDDIGPAEYALVPLTTVRQPTHEIGRTAVEVLVRRIAGETPPVQIVLAPQLIVRESSGAASGAVIPRQSLSH